MTAFVFISRLRGTGTRPPIPERQGESIRLLGESLGWRAGTPLPCRAVVYLVIPGSRLCSTVDLWAGRVVHPQGRVESGPNRRVLVAEGEALLARTVRGRVELLHGLVCGRRLDTRRGLMLIDRGVHVLVEHDAVRVELEHEIPCVVL